jgi:hypothetical protein
MRMQSPLFFQRKHLIAALLFINFSLSCSQTGNSSDNDLKQTFVDISKKRLQFYKIGDSSAWLNHTAEKYISINEDGSIETKTDLIHDAHNSHKRSDYIDTLGEYSDISFHKTGNAAVLNFKVTEFEIFNYKDTVYSTFERSEVYTFLDGRWQIVFSQLTPISENHFTVLSKYPAKMIRDTGVYLWYNGKSDTISYTNYKLYSNITHGSKEQLFAINDSVMILKDDLDKEIFHHDLNGKATYCEYVRPDGQSLKAIKIR